MLIFAWILWSIMVFSFVCVIVLSVAAVCAINEGRSVTLNIKPLSLLFSIAVFVFLTLYIFG